MRQFKDNLRAAGLPLPPICNLSLFGTNLEIYVLESQYASLRQRFVQAKETGAASFFVYDEGYNAGVPRSPLASSAMVKDVRHKFANRLRREADRVLFAGLKAHLLHLIDLNEQATEAEVEDQQAAEDLLPTAANEQPTVSP